MLKRLKRWLSDEHPEQVLIDMRPERPRYWHNPADPIQAARIEAALLKTIRRQARLADHAERSYFRNPAHFHSDTQSLNPFYVVRS